MGNDAMARTGQAATELVIILGVALVVVVLFFALSANMLTGARTQQGYDDARMTVQALVEAADSVYAQGEGATRKVAITLPGSTVFGANYTYIGAPDSSFAAQNGININVNGTDMPGLSRTSLTGQFPAKAGKYTMRVTSRGAYVEIYPYLVDVDKRSVTVVMARGETRSAQITVTRVSAEKVTVEPSRNWGFTDVTMAIDPQSAFDASSMGTVITVTVTATSAASDIYNSQITLNAVGSDSGTSETINIPVSVNVVGGVTSCRSLAAGCTESAQCCSGLCTESICAVPCSEVAQGCTQTSDCCSGLNCSAFLCMYACSSKGESCGAPGESCCDGFACNEGTCEAACYAEKSGCDENRQCCSGLCQDHACACAQEGGDCSGGQTCCSGLACADGNTCKAEACYEIEQYCEIDSQCCSGFCEDNACACVQTGRDCSSGQNSQCCSGLCQDYACACAQEGGDCSGGQTCCDGLACNGGTCEVAACLEQGEVCTETGECCPDQGLFCTSSSPPCSIPPCKLGSMICTTCAQSGNHCSIDEPCCGGSICTDGACTRDPCEGADCWMGGHACCRGYNCDGGVCRRVSGSTTKE